VGPAAVPATAGGQEAVIPGAERSRAAQRPGRPGLPECRQSRTWRKARSSPLRSRKEELTPHTRGRRLCPTCGGPPGAGREHQQVAHDDRRVLADHRHVSEVSVITGAGPTPSVGVIALTRSGSGENSRRRSWSSSGPGNPVGPASSSRTRTVRPSCGGSSHSSTGCINCRRWFER
jgi:hypothetical protein